MSAIDHSEAVSVRTTRVVAFLIDFALLSVLSVGLWFVFFVLRTLVGVGSMAAADSPSPGVSLGASLLSIVLGLTLWVVLVALVGGYFTLMLQLKGQTLGMRLLDVVVVSEDGDTVTQKQALVRTAVLLAPMPLMALSAVFIPLFGFLLALCLMAGWLLVEAAVLFTDDDAQRLGDRFAGTLVVEESV